MPIGETSSEAAQEEAAQEEAAQEEEAASEAAARGRPQALRLLGSTPASALGLSIVSGLRDLDALCGSRNAARWLCRGCF